MGDRGGGKGENGAGLQVLSLLPSEQLIVYFGLPKKKKICEGKCPILRNRKVILKVTIESN